MNPIDQNLQLSASAPQEVELGLTVRSDKTDQCDESIDQDLERRLNAIGEQSAEISTDQTLVDATNSNPVSMLDQFLQDESKVQASSRTMLDGVETATHYFRVRFEPKENRVILNLPFYPPLLAKPKVEARSIYQSTRIRVTQCERFGARIEIVTDQSFEMPTTLIVEVVGIATLIAT